MADTPAPTKVRLKNNALELLHLILSQPGWCKTFGSLYQAGKFHSTVVPPLPEKPLEGDAAAAWRKETCPEFEMSDSDFGLCRDAFKASIEKIVPGPASHELQEVLKLTS